MAIFRENKTSEMKKIAITLFLVSHVIFGVYGQSSMELTFTAIYNDQHVPIDSILIENLTQGGDTVLYNPDTVLVLNIATSIHEDASLLENSFYVGQNYPNPCSFMTSVDMNLPESQSIQINIYDVSGRDCGSFNGFLRAGKHKFTISPGSEKIYLLSVSYKKQRSTIKILNRGGAVASGSKCQIFHSSHASLTEHDHPIKSMNNFGFQPGDQLRYIVFSNTTNGFLASDMIEDIPVSSDIYEFSVNEGIPCPGIPYIYYESRKYNTVLIGGQCWFKEFLNVGTLIAGNKDMTDNGILEKYCYDDDTLACNYWGALYQWDEIMRYTLINGTTGICPLGWHIPTDEEVKELEGFVDSEFPIGDPEWDEIGPRGSDVGLNLKSKTGWNLIYNGLDKYGFSVFPVGFRTYGGSFKDWSVSSGYWTSTGDAGGAFARALLEESIQQKRNAYDKHLGFPVRCLKD